MNRLRRFLQLPVRRKLLIVEAALRLATSVLLVRITPASQLLRLWPAENARNASMRYRRHSSEEICWAITSMARCIPGATCLPQSVAARAMLRRAGYPADIRVGVAKGSDGGIEAHAWVASGEKILLGASERNYVELPVGTRL